METTMMVAGRLVLGIPVTILAFGVLLWGLALEDGFAESETKFHQWTKRIAVYSIRFLVVAEVICVATVAVIYFAR